MIVFERGSLLWVFNFHSTKSFADYRVGASIAGKYPLSQHEKFQFYCFRKFIFFYLLSYVLKGQSGTHLFETLSQVILTASVVFITSWSSSVPTLSISQSDPTLLISGDVKSLAWFERISSSWLNLGSVNTYHNTLVVHFGDVSGSFGLVMIICLIIRAWYVTKA